LRIVWLCSFVVVHRLLPAAPLVVFLHALGRSAKADAFGRSFAVFSTQVSAVGWRLRHSRLACGIMLEVSHDAVAAGYDQIVSFAAGQSKYCLSCTVAT